MLLALQTSEPLFAEWNRALLQVLFDLLPHSFLRDSFAEFLVLNPLASTWLYAAAFYLFWCARDERTVWRRSRLLEVILACGLSVLLTLAIRPWIGWPAPTHVPTFQNLYPGYLWENGTMNSFPSHSTLVYFLVAMGLWPLKRGLSLLLAVWTLLGISLPRIYVGGHYPVDVLASVVLAVTALWMVRRWCARPKISSCLARAASAGRSAELLLFLWLFELGEGFQASAKIISVTFQAIGRLAE